VLLLTSRQLLLHVSGGTADSPGIDLNGNWGHKFVPSRLACSESYSGQTAFEAHETRAMADYLVNGSNPETGRTLPIKAFIDLHSYGQLCELLKRRSG
jgi:hypothetical protein